MTFTRKNWRGIFGNPCASENIFSKIEQVKKLEHVLKFSVPKDTEVTEAWRQRIVDPKCKATPLSSDKSIS